MAAEMSRQLEVRKGASVKDMDTSDVEDNPGHTDARRPSSSSIAPNRALFSDSSGKDVSTESGGSDRPDGSQASGEGVGGQPRS